MNDERPKPEMDDATLDALLGEARWPEPTPASTRRLEAYWRGLNQPWVGRSWLVAAIVLLATGIAITVAVAERRSNVANTVAHGLPAPTVQPSRAIDVPPTVARDLFASRPPTSLELAELAMAESRQPIASKRRDPIDQAIELVINNEKPGSLADAVQLLATMLPREREIELFRKTRSADESQRKSAANLLAAVASSSAIPMLLELNRDGVTQTAAVVGLARVADPILLAKLARANADADQQRTLIAGILRSGNTNVYLDLVMDSGMSLTALGALDATPGISTDSFFAALYDPHVPVRLAAARVLGRIDGPETTARLVAMAERNQNRREALIALADSRGPEARQFLATARMSGPLVATVRSILLDQSFNNN